MQHVASQRFEVIQVLRAIAAMAVVIFHLPVVHVGQFGVDLFFVISGFIMCHVTERGNHAFLRKRIARIVPLYWLCTIAVAAGAAVAPRLFSSTSANGWQLVQSLLFIPFAKSNGIYPVLFLGWSLNFEMMFYAIFALAMLLSHRHRIALTGVFIGVLVVTGVVVDTAIVPITFYTQPIILEFAAGLVAYVIYRRFAQVARRGDELARRMITACCIVLACAVMIVFDVADQGLTRAMVWGGCSMVIVLASLVGWSDVRMPRWFVMIGDASYSLYLLHPYVIQGLGVVVGSISIGVDQSLLVVIMGPVICVAAAYVTYTYIERPLDGWLRNMLVRQ